MIKLKNILWLVVLMAALTVGLKAQDSGALVDALVKKGILTDQEAEEIRSDLVKEYSQTSAGKLNIASHVSQLKLYGDVRFRYQYDQQERRVAGAFGADRQDQQRSRYRLRLGAEYAFTDNFSAGVGVETNGGNDSANSTRDNAFSKNASDTIFLSLAYLKWSKALGLDWLELTGGRQKVGHVFSSYTWDNDVSPEGGLISLGKFKLGDQFYVSSTHGAYIYDDTRENTFKTGGFGGGASVTAGDDTWLFINQVTLGFSPSKDWNVELTPGFVAYSNPVGVGGVAGVAPVGQSAGVSPHDLNVLTLNLAVKNPLPFDLKGKLYGEYGYNLSATPRDKFLTAGVDSADHENSFFVLGYTIGENKKKGDWSLDASYAYFQTFSWDPNLADSDFADSRLNQHGYGVQATYNFTDWLTGRVNFRQSWQIDKGSPAIAGLTNDATAAAVSNLASTQILQVDLVWKF